MEELLQQRTPDVDLASASGVEAQTRSGEPSQPVGLGFILPFALAYFGFWMTLLTPPIVGMALYLSKVLPENQRNGALGLVLAMGGVIGVLVNPIVGKLSDRTTSRYGMRKPWMVGGTIVAIVGLLVTATSTTMPLILLGYCIASFGLNATAATLIPLLPDQVPHRQRGRVSGILGMGLPVGAVGGAGLAQAFAANPLWMFLAPAVVLAIGVAVLVTRYEDRTLAAAQAARLPRYGVREFLASFWVSPKRHPAFAWTWLSRFLVFMGVATLVTFQSVYLIEHLGFPLIAVPMLVALATSVHYLFVFAASPVAGWLSDRMDRRKIFVALAALFYAVGLGVIASAESFTAFLIGMAITGIGEGAYSAVDLALVTDVLPNPDDAGKEMGVFAVANTLPPAIAPAIAPALLAIPFLGRGDGGNFVALFAVAALLAVLGAVAISPVRTARDRSNVAV
nr:putative transporter EspT2 [uncultured bacterium]